MAAGLERVRGVRLILQMVEASAFTDLSAHEELRKALKERRLQRTMWPIFRQHTLSAARALCAFRPFRCRSRHDDFREGVDE